MPRMRLAIVLSATCLPAAAGPFESAREVLEVRCLECHTPKEAKGGLIMSTREEMLKGGDSGPALKPGDPAASDLLTRCKLPADDTDRMPPKKHGDPLDAASIEALTAWIQAGAPWPDGETLRPMAATALPRWNAAPDPRIVAIEVFPKEIHLETAADFHRAIAIVRMNDESTHDVTGLAKWTLDNPALAKLDQSTLTPQQDGSTALRIEYRGLKAEIPVTVKEAAKPRPVSFQLDVMPVLTAANCNTGSCHGSARGQDGFHLSLYGFDPKGDHFRLTTEMAGRRINTAIPEESLLITKAVGTVPHTGGKLIEPGSPPHQVLVEWIRSGAHYDADTIPQPVAIEVRPPQFVLTGENVRVPMTVRATYSDGTDRDVTPLTTFSTSNDNSVAIDPDAGLATSKHRGEAFLLARFHTFTEGSQAIVVPAATTYENPNTPAFNYIDEHIHRKLHKLRVIPSEVASDEVFLRRMFLDVAGLPPTPEERARFLADTRPDKRAAWIDELLARRESTEMWVMKWAELLQIRTFNNGPQQVSYKAALNYYQWLRERLASGQPFNEIVRQILAANGGTFSSPATNYYQIEQDVLKLTENTAQVFMGTRIQCAQCHNHPFDRWTMDDYYGFVSFFAQVKRKPAEDPREPDQRHRHPQLLACDDPTHPRRGAARLDLAGDRHPEQVQGPAARRPRGADRRRQYHQLLPHHLRPRHPRHGLLVRGEDGTQPVASAPPAEWRHHPATHPPGQAGRNDARRGTNAAGGDPHALPDRALPRTDRRRDGEAPRRHPRPETSGRGARGTRGYLLGPAQFKGVHLQPLRPPICRIGSKPRRPHRSLL